jgi:hypothetical protein
LAAEFTDCAGIIFEYARAKRRLVSGVSNRFADLTHFELRDFFGLIAQGWDMEDTGGKGSRGPLPPDAITVEHIVGGLDAERTGRTELSADEFNGLTGISRPLTAAELARVRERRRELFAQWTALPAGGTLVLAFPSATALARR